MLKEQKIEEFFSKTISVDDDLIHISRVRTSAGFCSIQIRVGEQKIVLSNTSDDFGDKYADISARLAEALERIADNPCLLPKEVTND